MRQLFKKIFFLITILLIIAIAGFIFWAQTPFGPMPETAAAMRNSEGVLFDDKPWLTFTYQGPPAPRTGVILYPGGRVDARSYTPLAHDIAAAGYVVIIPPMPLNLAVFNPDVADEIIAQHDEIERWVIGGHSLGGAMAANYVYNHPGHMAGLILWASYPADNNSLADRQDLAAISIYGSLETGAPEMAAAGPLLPPNTQWAVIEGGNHAQFGWYGPQPGDGTATISRTEQQDLILEATLDFLINLPSLP